jgi:hypothetical protein
MNKILHLKIILSTEYIFKRMNISIAKFDIIALLIAVIVVVVVVFVIVVVVVNVVVVVVVVGLKRVPSKGGVGIERIL